MIFTLSEYSAIQIILFNLLTLTLMIVFVLKPYNKPKRNKLEVFNEFFTLVLADLLFALTDYLEYEEKKYLLGKVYIGFIILLAIANVVIFLALKFRSFRNWLRIKFKIVRKLMYYMKWDTRVKR